MSNSTLISYTKRSPNRNSPRNHEIDTITIHCMAGDMSVESCGDLFAASSGQASSNYGIDSDGRIALYVDEADRSWCSSNAANDNRAVTIEVANDGGEDTGWHVSEKAYAALIELVTDICQRNGIKELKWKADKSLIGQVDKQNMTVHRWFANKACPGDYLYNLHSQIASGVNARLNNSNSSVGSNVLYRVQVGAYSVKSNADAMLAKVKAAGFDAFISTQDAGDLTSKHPRNFAVGDKVKVTNAVTYDGVKFALYYETYDVIQVNGDRIVIGIGDTVTAAIHAADLAVA